MDANESIAYIESCAFSETRLGLDRTRELLRRLGDPQKTLKFIHVAGTNGKGSACAMLASILRAAGYRTGLYTSPYISRFTERMQIDGAEISDDRLAGITGEVRPAADVMHDHPSQFELVTAVAMRFFAEARCDIVVLEVGLGGEKDSTNVIDCPEAAVIMNIGLEHTEYLGDTLEKIAFAKAGIIKPGCTAVCYRGAPEVERVFEKACAERHAELVKADFGSMRPLTRDLFGQIFSWRDYDGLRLSLLGEHQLKNATVVLETIAVLRKRGWKISEAAVRAGLSGTVWPARFEILNRAPLVIVDGAHNPQCAEALAETLTEYLSGSRLIILIGVLADKAYPQMLSFLIPFAARFICVAPDSPRALPAEKLAEFLAAAGAYATAADSIQGGVAEAVDTGEPVLACGSLYMAGRVRDIYVDVYRKKLRREGIRARRGIPEEERESRSRAIVEAIRDSEPFRSAQVVMLYKALPGEVDLSTIEDENKTFVYPVCTGDGIIEALCPHDGDIWRDGTYHIPEPVPGTAEIVRPETIDLVVCPCSGFDESKNRLGMGKGYYDRFLPKCRNATIAAVAFEAQKLKAIPVQPWDVPMDMVFTEKGWIETAFPKLLVI